MQKSATGRRSGQPEPVVRHLMIEQPKPLPTAGRIVPPSAREPPSAVPPVGERSALGHVPESHGLLGGTGCHVPQDGMSAIS